MVLEYKQWICHLAAAARHHMGSGGMPSLDSGRQWVIPGRDGLPGSYCPLTDHTQPMTGVVGPVLWKVWLSSLLPFFHLSKKTRANTLLCQYKHGLPPGPLNQTHPCRDPAWMTLRSETLRIIDSGLAYTVHHILDSCPWSWGTQYLVDPEEQSWPLHP